MVKGVNRQVIELTQVDSEYYERALLVVKQKYENFEEDILKQHAEDFVGDLGIPSFIKRKNRLNYWRIKLGLAVLFGALSAFTGMYIFYL